MLTATGYRVCDSYRTWPHLQRGDTLRSGLHFPDLTDPATLGCLLALVREAWGDPAMSVTAGYTKDRKVEWEVEHPHPDSLPEALWTYFDSEAAALVAALEAAP
jgi:hypothetical protein